MEIRSRRDDDIDGLVVLAQRVRETDDYPIHLPDDDYVGFLERPRPRRAWVAVDGSHPVGHVALNDSTSGAAMELVDDHVDEGRPIFVARLMVDPNHRQRGIGRRLLDQAAAAARELDREAFLDVVDVAGAEPAIGLYRRMGWEEIGQVSFRLGGQTVREIVFRQPQGAGPDRLRSV